jgi:glycerophosphoryl diester phosphodiesterase
MHAFFEVAKPTVIGHRGAAGDFPENTLPSFAAALAQGAHILESDVQLSRDGIPVLLHDRSVERTTDGGGRAADLDWADLGRLDAAHRFLDAAGKTSSRGLGIHIPRLEEAFDAFPEARFNLEIKSEDPRAIRASLDLIRRFDREDRTLLTAGEDTIMRGLRAALRSQPTRPALGASLGEIVASVESALSGSAPPAGVMALQVPAEFMGAPLVTRKFVDHAHAHGIYVHVWTINALDEIESLLTLGVDGIVTDYPGRMLAWLERDDRW